MLITGPNNELISQSYQPPFQPRGDQLAQNLSVSQNAVVTGSLTVLGFLNALGGSNITGGGGGTIDTSSLLTLSRYNIDSSSFNTNIGNRTLNSVYLIDSASIVSRLTREEATGSLLVAASASLQRYNADSGSFNTNIGNRLLTSTFTTNSASFSASIATLNNTSASLQRYNADSGSFNTNINNRLLNSNNLSDLTNVSLSRRNLGYMAHWEGYLYREEFRNGSSGLVLFAASNLGGTSNITYPPVVGELIDGAINLSTGTAAAVDQRGGYVSNLSHFFPGDGNRYYFGVGLRNNAPYFDGTLTGYYQFGFTDVASSIGNGFLGFISQNGGNWLCYSARGGLITSFDTGLSASTTVWRNLSFIYYEGGSRVEFFSEGNRIVTFWNGAGTNDSTNIYSANINISTSRAGVKVMCHRTAAVGTSVTTTIDYVDFGCRYAPSVAARFSGSLSIF